MKSIKSCGEKVSLLYSMEETLRMEKMRDYKNSFYDVFENCTQKELIDYKKRAGIPIVTLSIEDVKKSLNK